MILQFSIFPQKLIQDERSKSMTLLGSPQSIFVEAAFETDVKIAIKQLCGGWKIAPTNPQVRKAHNLLKMCHRIDMKEILMKLLQFWK